MMYSNPVITGFYPDPSVCRVGEDYYLVNSTFHYFPGVPVFHSRDLVNWRQIGHCLTRREQLNLFKVGSSMGIYAPTIRYHEGYFYMITTVIQTPNDEGIRNFYVRAAHPEGPWSDPVFLDWQGIDPSLLFDEDGTVYLTGTNHFSGEETGIYQATVDLESGKLLSPRQLIWKGTGGKSPEGPHLYHINNHYYLMIAEGGTEYGHMVTIARSSSPFGPFEAGPANPILSHRSTGYPIQATGHADLVQSHDGSWWAVMLGIRPISRRHYLGRETCLAPVFWSEDGWPIIGDNSRLEPEMKGPSFFLDQIPYGNQMDHFTTLKLKDEWSFLRNPYASDWSLEERPGWLTLNGSAVTLNDTDSPAFVGYRQQHFQCNVSTLLEFNPDLYDEAGLTVFMNEDHHYEIALTNLDGQRIILLRKRAGSIWMVAEQRVYEGTQVIFEVHTEPKGYTFYYRPSENKALICMGEAESSLLSTEVAGGFTGVYFGLYATGNGKQTAKPAYFDWFKYNVDSEYKN